MQADCRGGRQGKPRLGERSTAAPALRFSKPDSPATASAQLERLHKVSGRLASFVRSKGDSTTKTCTAPLQEPRNRRMCIPPYLGQNLGARARTSATSERKNPKVLPRCSRTIVRKATLRKCRNAFQVVQLSNLCYTSLVVSVSSCCGIRSYSFPAQSQPAATCKQELSALLFSSAHDVSSSSPAWRKNTRKFARAGQHGS